MSEVDFVMLLEDLPNKNKQVLQDLLLNSSSKNRTIKESVSEFLGQFNSDYKNGNIENLNFLTDYAFHKLSDDLFKDKPWPKLDQIDENLNLHDNVKLLYKELCYRHLFFRLQNSHVDIETRCLSFANYLEIFKALVVEDDRDLRKVELPCKWIWELFDECNYHFQNFCIYASKLKKDDPIVKEISGRKDLPNFNQLEAALKDLISRSQILESSGSLNIVEKPKTRHFVGYFAYLALIKLYLTSDHLDEAFKLVQACNMDYIQHFLKRSWCALISFFYIAGLTYILKNEFLKGKKTLEKCCSFFYRYKHFLSKSMQIDKYSRLAERSTLLLTIFLSFNKIETEDTIMRVITEKYNERYSKLLKYDQATFEETFTSGCCKIIKPLMTSEQFTEYLNIDTVDRLPAIVQSMLVQLNKYRILNGVESVLLIYSKLSVDKLARILSLDSKEVQSYLEEYETIREPNLTNSPFEQTFLRKAMTNLRTHSFEVKGNEITVLKVEDDRVDCESTIQDFIAELTQSVKSISRL